MKSEVKHRFGIDASNEEVINIISLSELDRKKKFLCPGCRTSFTPVIRGSVQSHFRHNFKSDTNIINCTGDNETYLHSTAKHLIHQNFLRCKSSKIPFVLTYKIFNDQGRIVKARIDLTKKFEVFLEQKDGRFTPDIMFKSNNQKFYFEINVTHECEPEKILHGIPIVELSIQDQSDLEELNTHTINLDQGRINLYNFWSIPYHYSFNPKKGRVTMTKREACWAYFFDQMDIKWEYRSEEISTTYTPSFWLPVFEGGIFVEVRETYVERAINSGSLVWVNSSLPNFEAQTIYGKCPDDEDCWEQISCGIPLVANAWMDDRMYMDGGEGFCDMRIEDLEKDMRENWCCAENFIEAIDKCRSKFNYRIH